MNISRADLTGKVTQDEMTYIYRGGYGEVYHGKYEDRGVAIKRLRYGHQPEEYTRHWKVCPRNVATTDNLSDFLAPCDAQIFTREMQVWSKLKDEHILPFKGYIHQEEEGRIFISLVSEWMENGTVIEYLKARKDANINRLVFRALACKIEC